MRRSRNKLQVSTFPFLAVLLAAMGALIFFLLVMDRRAKIVARNKAQDALAAKNKQQADKEAERLLAWQRDQEEHRAAEAALEQRLSEQQKQIQAELLKVGHDVSRAAEAVKQEEAEAARLRLEEESLRKFLGEAAKDLEAKTLARSLSKEQEEAARASLAKMTLELTRLEKALERLKSRAPRDNVFSVVPYRGKYGESRKPIYIECDARGVVMHPGGKRLPDLTPETLRQAIRDAGLTLVAKKETVPASVTEKTGPYVMCLVRPNGIGAYDRVVNALTGLDVDFGYEFVDAHWELDFSKEALAGAEDLPRAMARPPRLAKGPAPGGPGPGPVSGSGPAGGPPLLGKGGPTAPGGSVPGGTVPGGTVPGGSVPGGSVPGGSVPGGSVPGGSVPGGSFPGGSIAGSGVSGGVPGSVLAKGGERPIMTPPGSVTPPPLGVAGTDKTPSGKSDLPWRGSKDGGKEPGPGGPAGAGAGGGPGPEGPPEREGGFSGPLGKVTPRPPSLGHLLANRDFLIYITCTETEAQLKLSGERFGTDGNAKDQTRAAAELAEAVRRLIARRQASVRPGETPYRPLIRFQVQPSGLRTYYAIYPVLDGLRVPMSRENIE